MKLLHFVDAAGTDEHYVPASAVNMLEVTDARTVVVHFSNSDTNVGDHIVTLTTPTGSSDELLLAVAEQLIDTGVASSGVTKIAASTHFANSYGFNGASDLQVVAYTAGS